MVAKWAPQAEILEYMEDCAKKYDLMRHIRFGTEIAGATWDEDAAVWRIRTVKGEEIIAEVLVAGVGQLNRPNLPKLRGAEKFTGVSFHSARWRHDVDLAGKTVGVVGNAASAIQFVPQIAPRAGMLHIFQRSANWMVQRNDLAYTDGKAPIRAQCGTHAAVSLADLFPARNKLASVPQECVSRAQNGRGRRDLHAHYS